MHESYTEERRNRRRQLTAVIVTLSIVAFIGLAYFEASIHPLLASTATFSIGIFAGVIATVLHSNEDQTKHYTFDRIVNLVSGAEAAGLDRVERTLHAGTKAEDACNKASTTIDFIGVGGAKFLSKILNERTSLGRRIASGEVKVRIMLLNPVGEQVRAWTRDQKKLEKVQKDIGKSIDILRPCVNQKFLCRLYDFLPPLRILIVDGNHVLVSRYDPSSETGWDAPQLCFSNRPETTSSEFSKAFQHLYDHLWEAGEDLASFGEVKEA